MIGFEDYEMYRRGIRTLADLRVKFATFNHNDITMATWFANEEADSYRQRLEAALCGPKWLDQWQRYDWPTILAGIKRIKEAMAN